MKNKTAPSRNIKAPFLRVSVHVTGRVSQLIESFFLIYLDAFLIFHNIFPKT